MLTLADETLLPRQRGIVSLDCGLDDLQGLLICCQKKRSISQTLLLYPLSFSSLVGFILLCTEWNIALVLHGKSADAVTGGA